MVQHAETSAAIAGRIRDLGPRLYHVAVRVLASDSDAEDVVQQTFTDAIRAHDGFRGDASVDTWLWRIGHRNIGKVLRRRRRKEAALVPLDALGPGGDVPSAGPLLDEAADRQELVELATSCLAELEPGAREIIALRDLEELSNAEVAEILELSVSAVKSRLHRARLELRRAVALRLRKELHRADVRPGVFDVVGLFGRRASGTDAARLRATRGEL